MLRKFLATAAIITSARLTQAFLPFSSRCRSIYTTTFLEAAKSRDQLPQNDQGWKTILSPDQFSVLRKQATEPPGFSEGNVGQLEYELKKQYGTKYPKEGVYTCVGCGTPLYTAASKFDSGCGWPAYYEGLPGAIKEIPDRDGRRVEIVCSNCDSHLGHVFKGEGFPTPTNERHCVNGICLRYEAEP